jgi:hypothetical protein
VAATVISTPPAAAAATAEDQHRRRRANARADRKLTERHHRDPHGRRIEHRDIGARRTQQQPVAEICTNTATNTNPIAPAPPSRLRSTATPPAAPDASEGSDAASHSGRADNYRLVGGPETAPQRR